MKKQNITATSKADIYLNPLKLCRLLLKDKTKMNKAALVLPSIIASSVILPGTLLEGLFVSPFRNGKDIVVGEVMYPEQLQCENLLGKVAEDSRLRQSFYEQRSDKYSLHRLDINLLPNILDDNYRIMKMKLTCTFDDNRLICTDAFPQTKWVSEGLSVGEQVAVNAKGQFDVKPRSSLGDADIGHADVGYNYFYALTYSTLAPEVLAKYTNGLCAWTMNGSYSKYIADDTKHFTMNFLLPKDVDQATVTIGVEVGVTDRDRRHPDVYPATKGLHMTTLKPHRYKITFNK